MSELATAYIRSHPREFLRLTARRTLRFWTGTGTSNGSALFALHATFTGLFGWIGVGLLARRRRYAAALLLALPMLLFPLPYMVTHAEFRYRLVIDPVMTLAGAFALTRLYALATQRSLRREAPGACIVLPEATAWR
jgi:hypothetical protein